MAERQARGPGWEEENERLRTRLAEAEQTLEAIRRGEVDSLVVETTYGPRVYSLEAVSNTYRVLLESMSEGAATLSESGVILYGNGQLARLLDRPLQQVMGASLSAFVPADHQELLGALLGGDESHGEMVLQTARGATIPVYLSTQVVHDDRKLVCLIVVDLRAQKQAQAIRETEMRFRALVENLPELAWSARPDGFVDIYNQRWYEYTGTTFEEVQGWGWTKVHAEDTLPVVLETWRRSLATGEPFEMEYPLRGADGHYRWFLTRVRPLRDESGHIQIGRASCRERV